MSTLAVLPIKTFSEAKQRLSNHLTDRQRHLLMAAMAADVIEAVGRAKHLADLLIVSDEDEISVLANHHRIDMVPDRKSGSHSAGALIGTNLALAQGYRSVLLLPGDCPLLDPQEIDTLLSKYSGLHSGSVVVVPDRHGSGTNALLLAPPNAIEPAFGPDSFNRHLNLARQAGLPAASEPIPSLALDLDTVEDLQALTEALQRYPARAPRTRKVLAELKLEQKATVPAIDSEPNSKVT